MTDLLAIETSAEACSVALHCSGKSLVYFEHAPMRHAELLLPAVRALLSEAGMALADLDAIAFGRGPGSFTSLRIGIGVVQGLAWATELPVVPISSLAAVAQRALEVAGKGETDVCVAVDARMQEVYTANYKRDPAGFAKLTGDERVCPPGLVAMPGARGSFIAAGNGFSRFAELESQGAEAAELLPDICPRAEIIAKLALRWMENHSPIHAALAQPVYLRNKVASKPDPA